MYVKVCGVTTIEDARAAIDAGTDAIGLNLIPESRRYITADHARELQEYIGEAAHCIAVVAHCNLNQLRSILTHTRVARLQLHGHEPEEWLTELSPFAFRAARIATANDVQEAEKSLGHPLLVDAKVEGALGGTGKRVDWPLVSQLASKRPLILAGGLTPDNVAEAVRVVQPFGIDVASGVEISGNPRRKDSQKMKLFVQTARLAASEFSDKGWNFLTPPS